MCLIYALFNDDARALPAFVFSRSLTDSSMPSKSSSIEFGSSHIIPAAHAFQGYIEDNRNTDNAWIESTVVNIHDESPSVFQKIDFTQAQSSSAKLQWVAISNALNISDNGRAYLKAVCRFCS